DASLVNSRILTWPISGEMALRTGWGDDADFVLSVGGFHPRFPTPANFPALDRLTINFGRDNPRVTFTAYQAVTLNTAQIGARLDLFVNGPDIWLVGDFDVEGHAYFDAILHFSPFAFDAALGLGLTLLRDGDPLCSIGGDLRLAGPNPYRISGKVWAEVLGIRVSVPVRGSFGDAAPEARPLADGLALLLAAVQQRDYWEPIAPAAHVSGVALAAPPPGATGPLRVDPAAGLRFSQRVLPLGVTLDKLGTARFLNDYRTFELRAVDAAGGALPVEDAYAPFAPGQFFDLDDDEALAAPASEPYRSGVSVASPDRLAFPAGAAVPMAFEYETVPLLDEDEAAPATLGSRFAVAAGEAPRWFGAGLAGIARPLGARYLDPSLRTRRVSVAPAAYAVATEALTPVGVVAGAAPAGTPRVGPYGQVRSRRREGALVA
ncbi:MAG TPA: DUF6603 domain-containing protein, partial [Methylomirabilota bacterium]|nr:DUF6603 domain-containing protein [Methylomirabilota bacterium]